MQVLLLPLGATTLAIDLRRCREVVELPRVTPLPTAPKAVLGLVNVRGEAVPVVDTAALLSLDEDVTHEPPYAMVVDAGLGVAALAVTGCPTPGTWGGARTDGDDGDDGDEGGDDGDGDVGDDGADPGSSGEDDDEPVLVNVESLLAGLRRGR